MTCIHIHTHITRVIHTKTCYKFSWTGVTKSLCYASTPRELLLLATIKHQLGPQQLKYMTVRRDSSACLSFSLLADLKAVESAAAEKHLACFEEEEQAEAESFKDLNAESPFDAWSLTTCITLIPAW